MGKVSICGCFLYRILQRLLTQAPNFFIYCMLFVVLRGPNPFPSVTGTSYGLIPARRSSEGWISVPSKPSVARMVMTTLLRWETPTQRRREGGRFCGIDFITSPPLHTHHCLLFGDFHHVDISLWELCFTRVLIRSLSLKFSMSGLIYTAGALECLAGN